MAGNMVQRVALLLVSAGLTILAGGAVAQQGSPNSEALVRSWEWWKGLSEDARTQLAPKLVEVAGKLGTTASLAVTSLDNTSRYRALCARRSGVFRDTALCRGLQYTFAERSPWSTVMLGLYRRAGTQSADGRNAAALLVGLRDELRIAGTLPAQPQVIIAGLYGVFGRCAPPSCRPGLEPGAILTSLLTAAASFTAMQGNDEEVQAARILEDLGWR